LYPEKQEIPATYELRPKTPRELKSLNIVRTSLVIAGIVAAFATGLVGLLHENNVSRLQATQIRELESANTRLAGELSAESSQLTQVSAKLAAADPASDSNLITCRDLRTMGLMATNGAGIVTGGGISLNQSPVPLPGHCKN
jgi:hypothetical protein